MFISKTVTDDPVCNNASPSVGSTLSRSSSSENNGLMQAITN